MKTQPTTPAHVSRLLDDGRARAQSPKVSRALSDRETSERAKALGKEASRESFKQSQK